jgi:hypothetical protein
VDDDLDYFPIDQVALDASLQAYAKTGDTESPGFGSVRFYDSANGLYWSLMIQDSDVLFQYPGGPLQRLLTESDGFLLQSTLNTALYDLVTANTGRAPLDGEVVTIQMPSRSLIWGAPVYDHSFDFSNSSNSMYVSLTEDI